MIDTVFVLNDTLANPDLEVLTKVNEFYNSAWEKLILYGALLVFIIGAVVPLLISHFQRQSFKDEISRIIDFYEKGIDKRVENIMESSKKEIKEDFSKEFSNLDKKIQRNQSSAILISLFIKLQEDIKNQTFEEACFTSLLCLMVSVSANDKVRFNLILKYLREDILLNIKANIVNDIIVKHEGSLEAYLRLLKDIDNNKEFTSEIDQLEKALKAKLAEEESTEEQDKK